MPEETEFSQVYQGDFLTVKIALPIYIIVSKARAGRTKDIQVIQKFLIENPDQEESFLKMVKCYAINLDFLT